MTRVWPPLREGHPAVGLTCPACGKPLQVGDETTIHQARPADAEDERRRDEGRAYVESGQVGHAVCP